MEGVKKLLNIISCILFSISANFDNIIIGMSFGSKNIHIPIIKNIIISVFTTIITILSMKFGEILFILFTPRIVNLLGSISLIAIGIIGILKILYNKYLNKNNETDDNNKIPLKSLNTKELITIIFTLSLNNIATGIAASAAGINILFSFISTLVTSFLFIYIGNNLGKNVINNYLKKNSEVIGSILLIILGIIEWLF